MNRRTSIHLKGECGMSKFLPVGIQDLEKMIRGNLVYMDKGRYVFGMVRPRCPVNLDLRGF